MGKTTLPSKYKISVISLDIESGKLQTKSYATETIKKHILDTLQTKNTQTTWIDFEAYEKEDFNSIKIHFQKELEKISENNKWQTIIIGISLLGHYIWLKYFSKKILEIKKQNPNFIFLLWGANFPIIPEIEQLQLLKDYGIDLISIGGWKSISTFLENIEGKDVFQRDNKWELKIKNWVDIPNNFIQTSLTNENELKEKQPGEAIKPTAFLREKCIDYSFSHSCSNSCGYCAANKQNFWRIDTKLAIQEINEALKQYENPIRLNLQDLNPLQRNSNDFLIFLRELNREKIEEIWMFGDFMSLSTERWLKNTEQLLDLFTYGELKNKKLSIWIAIDSTKSKEDWEFLQRKFGNRNFNEQEHANASEKFTFLLEKYKNKNIKFQTSFIFHPAMNLETYNEKLQLMNILHDKWVEQLADYTLKVHPNTPLERENKQNVIPQYLLHTYHVHEEYASQRSLFYKNAMLLDIYSYLGFCEYTIPEKIFLFKTMSQRISDEEIEAESPEQKEKMKKVLCFLSFFRKEKERVINQNNMNEKQKLLIYMNFMIHREKNILWKNIENTDEEKIRGKVYFIKHLDEICTEIEKNIISSRNENK